jgi:hypothetical protein
MPQGTRLRAALIKCGKCGKRYSNPLAHVCVVSTTRRRGKTKLAPQVKLSRPCPNCGKEVSNPLTHVCQLKRGDFKRRMRAAKARERKAKRDANRHDYATCPQGEDCERFPCRVYAEGWKAGHSAGYAEGHQAGYDEGYQAGQQAAED